MAQITTVPVVEKVNRTVFENEIKPLNSPVILKGLAQSWPCVDRAAHSPRALAEYLKARDAGATLNIAICPAEFEGRYFYNADLTGFNFRRAKCTLSEIIDRCLGAGEHSDAYYLEAAEVDIAAPRLADHLDMALIDQAVRPRMWLSNSVRTQTHFDMLDNIAVHVAGDKVFTLFPPEQIANLYPGPMDLTPAGAPISMVPLDRPDFDRYPGFRDALASAREARLEPGDALYLPALWWHHVSTEGPLNMLVNYWWTARRQDLYSPISALYMAALSYKHMPAAERDGWGAILKYFIFEEAGDPVRHLPPHVHSVFGANLTANQLEQFKMMFRRTVKL